MSKLKYAIEFITALSWDIAMVTVGFITSIVLFIAFIVAFFHSVGTKTDEKIREFIHGRTR